MAVVGSVEIPVELDTKSFESQIAEAEAELQRLVRAYESTKKAEPFKGQQEDLEMLASKIEKLRNKIIELTNKQQDLGNEGEKSSEKVGNGFGKLVPKIAKLGLVVFGVRSAFSAVRRAMSSYLGENITTANKLNSIWVALGNVIGPIIEKIANWVVKLISYINVFVKTVSRGKIDLTKNMGKNTKAVKETSGAMKELNKQLAQFDEATVLQDQKLDSGGGAGALDDSFKLPELDENIVKKIQDLGNWFLDHWEEIKTGLIAIGGAIATIKLGKLVGGLGTLFGSGAGAGVGGAVGGIGTELTGLGGALTIFNAALVGIGVTTAVVVAQHNDITRSAKEAREEYKNLATVGETATKVQEKYKDMLKDTNTTEEQRAKITSTNAQKIKGTGKLIQSYSKDLKQCNGFLYSFGSWLHDDNTALEINQGLVEKNTSEINSYCDELKEMNEQGALTKAEKEEYIKVLLQEYEDLSKAKRSLDENSSSYFKVRESMQNVRATLYELSEGTDYYKDKMGLLKNKAEETGDFLNNVYEDAKKRLDVYNKTPIADKAAKVLIDADTSKANNGLTSLVNNLGNAIQNAFKKLNLKDILRQQINAFPTAVVSSLKSAFGLARGGIINLPGPGVPLTSSVVGGERAPEGVIPLSDSQMMETLGEAIGRYITINASITNTMNGRVISRELQKINNENDFGSNR